MPLHSQLQNSALALDVYSWLAHRLCRVRDSAGVDLSWGVLQEQFGQEYQHRKNFKRNFLGALRKAAGVYKDARIEELPEGVRLLPSPPSVRRAVVSVRRVTVEPDDAKPAEIAAPARHGLASVGGTMIEARYVVSEDAMAKAMARIAPGWSRDFLQVKFATWAAGLAGGLKFPVDKAFIGWAPGFTKGKAPS